MRSCDGSTEGANTIVMPATRRRRRGTRERAPSYTSRVTSAGQGPVEQYFTTRLRPVNCYRLKHPALVPTGAPADHAVTVDPFCVELPRRRIRVRSRIKVAILAPNCPGRSSRGLHVSIGASVQTEAPTAEDLVGVAEIIRGACLVHGRWLDRWRRRSWLTFPWQDPLLARHWASCRLVASRE